jgi:hypothetical protein
MFCGAGVAAKTVIDGIATIAAPIINADEINFFITSPICFYGGHKQSVRSH